MALLPTSVFAAEGRQGGEVIVAPEETLNDDLYAAGGTVNILGTINDDLVATGGTVTVRGEVTGGIIVAGGTVIIAGPVRGSVRAGGGDVRIESGVGDDVIATGGNVVIARGSTIGRDLWVGSGSLIMDGKVGRNMLAGAGDVVIGGAIEGNVEAQVSTLRLTGEAEIGGNLIYTSEQEAEIDPGATVGGTVERRELPERDTIDPALAAFLDWLRSLVGLFALGLALALLFPGPSRQLILTLYRSPWASLGLGFLTLVVTPIATAIIFVIGILIGGWWLAPILLALYVIALVLAYVIAALFVGGLILDRAGRSNAHLVWALLLGLVVLSLVGLVPVPGSLVSFVAILFGLGALVLLLARRGSAPPSRREEPVNSSLEETRPEEPRPD